MPLADLQMPSITGSEAVDKYIYIPERPPDNQILIQFCYSQSDSEKTTQSRFSNAPPFIWRKTWLIWSIYDEHSPYATVYHPILPETFTAVPNRQHSLSDIHQKPPTHSSCLYLCADISAQRYRQERPLCASPTATSPQSKTLITNYPIHYTSTQSAKSPQSPTSQ